MTELRDDGIDTPHPDRFSSDDQRFDDCMAAHRLAIVNGQQGYIDPFTGLFVMTAEHLAARSCCENRCRHCPWVAL